MPDEMTDADLDAFAEAGARLLGLPLEDAWRAGVRANLRVSLTLGGLVDAFPLPDETEPAPVFVA